MPAALRRQGKRAAAASPLARVQADKGGRVTNLRHELVHLGAFERQLLRLLDRTRTRADLAPPRPSA